jgi:UDP-N-acetylglucosamine/UDP-N-acetylgalactosamine diphosphorylase
MTAVKLDPAAAAKERLLARLAPLGQEHLLAFWDQLSPAEQEQLARQIEAIDPAVLGTLQEQCRAAAKVGPAEGLIWAALAAKAQPPRAMRLDDSGVSFSKEEVRRRGSQLLKSGKVGMILVAGGLGTRLGFDQPKGMLPIGPLSGRTLFQVMFERVRAIGRRYGVRIPLFLMTSPATDEVTRQFLRDNNNFGLAADDVRIFCQATMWALDDRGERILMESPGSLFLGPDGHGGMLAALDKSGSLAAAQRRGIEHFFYCQIDNPLTQLCDEKLLGSHVLAGSEITTQVVRKRHPLERVGNVVSIDGRTHVIEYSDLPDDIARQTNADGSLKLWAGNLAIHVMAVEFLARCAKRADALPFHRARKKVPHIDSRGKLVQPERPNAFRFERFIFDLLPLARQALVVEADAAEAFAPVKNSDAEKFDTPRTAKAAMIALHARWLREAGANVAPGVPVEINPLWADGPEELRGRVQPGTTIDQPTYFSPTGPQVVELPLDELSMLKPTGDASPAAAAHVALSAAHEARPAAHEARPVASPAAAAPVGTGLVHAVIMAGGAGTRFWPLSRTSRPKQLLDLVAGRTMIQATVDRLAGLVPAEQTWVITNRTLVEPIAEQLPAVARRRIVGEPCKRDTAPAVGLSALLAAREDPDAILVVMPSDHLIQPAAAFQAAIRQAVAIVEDRPETLVTFGIKPTYPAETFGYIERGEGSGLGVQGSGAEAAPAYNVIRFREKPARSIAEEYLAAGTFYWNSGIFVWKAKTILAALEKYEPEMYQRLQTIGRSIGQSDFAAVLDREFTAIRGKSIDYAVMEYYWPVVVIEAPFTWDDVGSWQALARSQGTNADGNAAIGKHLGIRTTGSIVRTSGDHLVVTLGVADTIVVHTPDATLVADKSQEEAIREVVKALESRGWSEYL